MTNRKIAVEMGISITGTLRIILQAKQVELLSAVKPVLEKIRQTNFHLTKNPEDDILRITGEI